MNTYEKLFAEYGQIVAQVLLTRTEVLDRHRYTNSRNTFMELLKQGVIPIVNENDVVALDDLKIGDNDNMSALVATQPTPKPIRMQSLCTKYGKLHRKWKPVPELPAADLAPAACLPRFRRQKRQPVPVSA